MFVVVKYRPSLAGEDDRIDAVVKKVPVHQTILPEAWNEREGVQMPSKLMQSGGC